MVAPLNQTPIRTTDGATSPRLRHPCRRVEIRRARPQENGGQYPPKRGSVFRRGHEHAGGHVARTDTATKLLRSEANPRWPRRADLQAFSRSAEDKRAARFATRSLALSAY